MFRVLVEVRSSLVLDTIVIKNEHVCLEDIKSDYHTPFISFDVDFLG